MNRLASLATSAALVMTPVAPATAAEAPKDVTVLRHLTFDGVTDDLVGLAARPAPYADPLHPTAAELRRATMTVRLDPASGHMQASRSSNGACAKESWRASTGR